MIVSTKCQSHGETKISNIKSSDTKIADRLIAEAKTQPQAFTVLYRKHYDAIFRYCVHRLFDRHVAEDVTSAVFLKVVENIDKFKGSERQFRSWLYRIATNEINGYLRRKVRRQVFIKLFSHNANHEFTDSQRQVDANTEKLAILKSVIGTLKPRYQTIITLRFFENLKLTEIADVLGSSPATVRSQLSRVLAKLRKKIAAGQEV